MLSELPDAIEQFLCVLADLARVLVEFRLLPLQRASSQQRQQRRGGGDDDPLVERLAVNAAVFFKRRDQTAFKRHEQDGDLNALTHRLGVLARRERANMGAQSLRVRGSAHHAIRVRQRRIKRVEVRIHRHLRIDRHEPPARQAHRHVRPQLVALVAVDARLLVKVNIGNEPRHLGDVAQRDLSPAPALAIVAQRARQRLRRA